MNSKPGQEGRAHALLGGDDAAARAARALEAAQHPPDLVGVGRLVVLGQIHGGGGFGADGGTTRSGEILVAQSVSCASAS